MGQSRPATKRQLWALYCITKKDHRDSGLTLDQASKLIAEANVNRASKLESVEILNQAYKAGEKAYEDCVPTPMIVQQYQDMLNDNSPVEKSYHVPEGVCGFAWVNLKCKGKGFTFINDLKKEGLATSDHNSFNGEPFKIDSYYGGYTYWVSGSQSMERKIAFASAFAKVLTDAGINCHAYSRMD